MPIDGNHDRSLRPAICQSHEFALKVQQILIGLQITRGDAVTVLVGQVAFESSCPRWKTQAPDRSRSGTSNQTWRSAEKL